MRDTLLGKIQTQYDEDPAPPPVVALDEYFTGNTDEECIAPNQVGYGRPALAEFYSRFKAIQQKPTVQAVLVGIHGDWTEVCSGRKHVFIVTMSLLTATPRRSHAWETAAAQPPSISAPRAARPCTGNLRRLLRLSRWPWVILPTRVSPSPGTPCTRSAGTLG
jgi:hypothetical protein